MIYDVPKEQGSPRTMGQRMDRVCERAECKYNCSKCLFEGGGMTKEKEEQFLAWEKGGKDE